MNIADMRFRGIILTPSFTADGSGGTVCDWGDAGEIWCGVALKGEYYQLTARKNDNIQPGCRISIGNIIYLILQVANADDLLILKCRLAG